MKKFKVSMIAVVAVIIALAGSAFTTKKSIKRDDPIRYYFQYNLEDKSGLTDPSNWTQVEGTSSACSSLSGVNCVMHIDDVPPVGLDNNPDFSTAGITTDGQVDALTETFKGE